MGAGAGGDGASEVSGAAATHRPRGSKACCGTAATRIQAKHSRSQAHQGARRAEAATNQREERGAGCTGMRWLEAGPRMAPAGPGARGRRGAPGGRARRGKTPARAQKKGGAPGPRAERGAVPERGRARRGRE
eukprot:7541616-Lingulodinium_polyedra.AAC.1